MHGQSWSLGEVFTVIKDKPYRFSVTAHDNADTHDPLGQNPLLYWFKDQDRGTRPDDLTFNVVVSRRMARMDAVGQPPPETHNRTIRFGLVSKAHNPDGNEFPLKTDTHDRIARENTLSGQSLRRHILRFFLRVNSEWPDQGIGIPDLCDNFYALEKDIEGTVNRLIAGKFLEQKRAFQEFRENRGKEKRQTFLLTADPALLDRVEREVSSIEEPGTGKKHRVFISYSSKDSDLAGEIKRQLEGLGLETFLAHADIVLSQEWRNEIKSALEHCDSFVALVTENFHTSDYTDQEAGLAMAWGKQICSIKCGAKPYGFLLDKQYEELRDNDTMHVCRKIYEAVTNSSNGKA